VQLADFSERINNRVIERSSRREFLTLRQGPRRLDNDFQNRPTHALKTNPITRSPTVAMTTSLNHLGEAAEIGDRNEG
jgi:hypothetical protein